MRRSLCFVSIVTMRLLFISEQIGIVCRLQHPSDAMSAAYGPVVIEAVLIATYFFIGVVSCCLIPLLVVCLAREFCIIDVVELE